MIGGAAMRAEANSVPPSSPRAASWSLRLLLLAVAFGMVLMHHFIGAHQHLGGGAANQPAPAHASTSDALGNVPVGAAAGHDAVDASPSSTAAHAVAPPDHPGPAFLHIHHDTPGHDMAAVLHECLAVLAAAAALALALYLASRRHTALSARQPHVAGSADLARPPPVPLRLAQLQVLRL